MFALLFLILLTILNAFFVMAEAALISARRAKLQQQANEGDLKARAALELVSNPNRLLSTTQIGITLIVIFSGAFGEATLTEDLSTLVQRIPWLADYSQPISLALVVLGITYVSLVIGELVPKRLALHNPERIAGFVAAPMQWLSALAHPAISVLSVSTELILRLLGAQPSQDPPITEEEIRVLMEQGTQAGVFDEAEQDMVTAVFRLGDRRAGELMVPRTEIMWLDLEDSLEEIIDTITGSGYSRFPVCQDDLDHVIGIVQSKDLLARSLTGQPLDLKHSLRPPLFVPESNQVVKVLELFKQSQMPLALVIDEYGGTQGLITLNDILEAIVGDVEVDEPQAVQRQDGSWLLDGTLLVEEFKEILELEVLPAEAEGYYQTLGGFVMMCLGRIPTEGDYFQWHNLRFEVVDMDGRRVDKVLVLPDSSKSPDTLTDNKN